MNLELERMREEASVAYFKMLSLNSPKFEPGTSQYESESLLPDAVCWLVFLIIIFCMQIVIFFC
jgi:hypothetical protein